MSINTGNCKDCKWWEDGVCDYSGSWDNVSGWGMKSNEFEIDAYASDDTGLDCKLKTGKDFGCVQFRDKNNITGGNTNES